LSGSTTVGKIIARRAAEHLKPCLLELGGKSPLIVLDDADLDEAVKAAAFGAYMNQGQICMSTERIIVVDAVADEFVRKFAAKAATLRAGVPRPVGRGWDGQDPVGLSGLGRQRARSPADRRLDDPGHRAQSGVPLQPGPVLGRQPQEREGQARTGTEQPGGRGLDGPVEGTLRHPWHAGAQQDRQDRIAWLHPPDQLERIGGRVRDQRRNRGGVAGMTSGCRGMAGWMR